MILWNTEKTSIKFSEWLILNINYSERLKAGLLEDVIQITLWGETIKLGFESVIVSYVLQYISRNFSRIYIITYNSITIFDNVDK